MFEGEKPGSSLAAIGGEHLAERKNKNAPCFNGISTFTRGKMAEYIASGYVIAIEMAMFSGLNMEIFIGYVTRG